MKSANYTNLLNLAKTYSKIVTYKNGQFTQNQDAIVSLTNLQKKYNAYGNNWSYMPLTNYSSSRNAIVPDLYKFSSRITYRRAYEYETNFAILSTNGNYSEQYVNKLQVIDSNADYQYYNDKSSISSSFNKMNQDISKLSKNKQISANEVVSIDADAKQFNKSLVALQGYINAKTNDLNRLIAYMPNISGNEFYSAYSAATKSSYCIVYDKLKVETWMRLDYNLSQCVNQNVGDFAATWDSQR